MSVTGFACLRNLVPMRSVQVATGPFPTFSDFNEWSLPPLFLCNRDRQKEAESMASQLAKGFWNSLILDSDSDGKYGIVNEKNCYDS